MPKTSPRNFCLFKPSPLIHENVETARSLITKWDSISTSNHSHTTPLFTNTRHEAKQYLNAVKSLQSSMQYLVARDSSSENLIQAQLLMQLAMKKLETEFYRILAQNRDRLDPDSLSSSSTYSRSSVSDFHDEFSVDSESTCITDTVSTDLKEIAECMISTGYSKECAKIYVIVRKSIVDETLYNLGVEKLSFSQVQKMDWELLERKIKFWKNAVKVAVNT